ncbi:response regulator, partial [Candidatus Pacearchaeota archaeon]|nr:response regulator [Candidatus Pacearchaeota archaeon]
MGEKILVVDNNPVILRLLTHFLQKEGHSVKTADDGLSALEVLQSFHPDILIIDLIMPQISGDKLCRIVSNQPKFDNTLIVILSSIAAEGNIDFISLGADACVAKGPAKEM